MSELRVERLAKQFGGLRVFQDISFTLRPGEVMGVIGPNGAGKTTLINVISGRLRPSVGRVFVAGRDVTGQPSHAVSRLGVARSFQQTNTFRSVSVTTQVVRSPAVRRTATPGPSSTTSPSSNVTVPRPASMTNTSSTSVSWSVPGAISQVPTSAGPSSASGAASPASTSADRTRVMSRTPVLRRRGSSGLRP